MITLVFGAPGTGKSTLARKLIGDAARVICIDGLGELPGRDHVAEMHDASSVDWEADDLSVIWTAPPAWELWRAIGYHASHTLLVIDEADLYWPTPATMAAGLSHPCADLVARHRHYRLDIVALTQRPRQTPPLVRSLAGEVYCFAIAEEDSKRYVLRSWGIRVPTRRYRFVRWTLDTIAEPRVLSTSAGPLV